MHRIITRILNPLFRTAETFTVTVGVIVVGAILCSGCRSEDSIVVKLHNVKLSESEAELIRAEKLIKDFGLEVDEVKYGFRNGTFISITVTGREKRFSEKYVEEREKRLELERRLREAGASD